MEVVGAAFAVRAAKPGRPVGLLEVRRSGRAACAGQVSGRQPRVPRWPSAGFGVGRTEAERAATAGARRGERRGLRLARCAFAGGAGAPASGSSSPESYSALWGGWF